MTSACTCRALLSRSQVMQALVRQAQLGASCGVEVPTGQGLTSHPYRVLQLCRRLKGNEEGRGGKDEVAERSS